MRKGPTFKRMMILTITILVSFQGFSSTSMFKANGNIIESANINNSTKYINWNITGSPYFINENLTIPIGVTLQIEPGVEVIFNNSNPETYCSMIIRGTLLANGTKDNPIKFIPTRIPLHRLDRNIKLDFDNSNSILNNCEFESFDVILYINGSSCIISNSIFKNITNGIYFIGESSPVIKNNKIIDCTIGISISTGSTPLIYNNTFSNFSEYAISTYDSYSSIISNKISSCRIGIRISGGKAYISDNIITDCERIGILSTSSDNLIYNTTIISTGTCGMDFSYSDSVVKDCKIINSGEFDLILNYNTTITSINTLYDKTKVQIKDDYSKILYPDDEGIDDNSMGNKSSSDGLWEWLIYLSISLIIGIILGIFFARRKQKNDGRSLEK